MIAIAKHTTGMLLVSLGAGEVVVVDPVALSWNRVTDAEAVLTARAWTRVDGRQFLPLPLQQVVRNQRARDQFLTPSRKIALANLTFDQRRAMVEGALRTKLGLGAPGYGPAPVDFWVRDLDESTVYYQTGGKTFSRSYSIAEDGSVQLEDDVEEVFQSWEPLSEQVDASATKEQQLHANPPCFSLANPLGINQYGGPEDWGKKGEERSDAAYKASEEAGQDSSGYSEAALNAATVAVEATKEGNLEAARGAHMEAAEAHQGAAEYYHDAARGGFGRAPNDKAEAAEAAHLKAARFHEAAASKIQEISQPKEKNSAAEAAAGHAALSKVVGYKLPQSGHDTKTTSGFEESQALKNKVVDTLKAHGYTETKNDVKYPGVGTHEQSEMTHPSGSSVSVSLHPAQPDRVNITSELKKK